MRDYSSQTSFKSLRCCVLGSVDTVPLVTFSFLENIKIIISLVFYEYFNRSVLKNLHKKEYCKTILPLHIPIQNVVTVFVNFISRYLSNICSFIVSLKCRLHCVQWSALPSFASQCQHLWLRYQFKVHLLTHLDSFGFLCIISPHCYSAHTSMYTLLYIPPVSFLLS